MGRAVLCCVGVLLWSLIAGPGFGQYIYIDANGDGARTDTDYLKPSGSTVISVYLDTMHDRSGALQSCNSHSAVGTSKAAIDVFSYDLILRVDDGTGTVAWGEYVDDAGFAVMGKDQFSETEYVTSHRMDVGPLATETPKLPPGLHKLGHISVTVMSGAPSVGIGTTSTVDTRCFTGFGTKCSASEYPNTYLLGTDWFDTAGVAAPRRDVAPGVASSEGGFGRVLITPTPSRGRMAVHFSTPVQASARLDIFDGQGRLVFQIGATRMPAGKNAFNWDGKATDGKDVASGIYFARVTIGRDQIVERFVIAR